MNLNTRKNLIDSKSNIQHLIQFLLLTILINQTQSVLKVNEADILPLYDSNYEESSTLNFTKGKWYIMTEENTLNKDSRLLEFHPETGGFINMMADEKIMSQNYIESPRRIFAFYKNSPTSVEDSIIFRNQEPNSVEEVEELISEKYENINAFEMGKMIQTFLLPDNTATNKLLNFPLQMERAVDEIANVEEGNLIPMENTFIIDTLKMMADPILMEDIKGINTNEPVSLYLSNKGKQKKREVKELLPNILEIEQDQHVFEDFYDKITYFIQGCIRRKLFSNDSSFFTALFAEYSFKKTFTALVDNSLKEILVDEVSNFKNLQSLALDKPDEIQTNLKSLAESFLNLFNTIQPVLVVFLEKEPIELTLDNFNEISNFEKMIEFYSRDSELASKYWDKYTDLVKEGVPSIPSIEENGISDLDDIDEFNALRKKLFILGYCELNSKERNQILTQEQFRIMYKNDRLLI
jgi:hypothetical protein